MGDFSLNCGNSRTWRLLYFAKFNKLTVEPRGTMLAELISVRHRSKERLLVFEYATMREDGMSERLLKPIAP
ncbi:MAG: hypothetical protein J2P52_12860 [Blastocatellia bacterium]|nr:hypothetical protein [Blastocatellia bacterium]